MDGRIAHIEADVERLMKIVSDGNGRPALTVQVAQMSTQLGEMKETIDGLPGKLLTWLLIFTALIGIITFAGPSIRKAMGMAAMKTPMNLAKRQPEISTIPPLRGQ